MDTDINNYTYNELIQLLKLNDGFNSDTVVNNTFKILNKIDNSSFENKVDLTEFFKKCFIKIMIANNYTIHKDIIDSLKLTEIISHVSNSIPNLPSNNHLSVDTLTTLPKPIPTTAAISSIQSEYAYGTINPVKRDTIKHLLILNSKYETLEKTTVYNKLTGCDCKIKLADFTTNLLEPYKNVISIKIDSIHINNSYYPFSHYLDTVSFTISTFIYNPSITNPPKQNLTNTEIVISEGVYTINTLLNSINSAIQDLSSNVILGSVKLRYDSILGKFIFFLDSSSVNYGFDLHFTTLSNPERPTYLNMGWIMGFQKEYYDFFEDYKNFGFVADCPAKLIGSSFFLIEVEDYNKNNPILINYNINSPYSFNLNNLLAIIPNQLKTNYNFNVNSSQEQKQDGFNETQTQSQSTIADFNDLSKQSYISSTTDIFKTRRYFGPVRIKKLRIRLLDENGRVLYLNNCNFTLTLAIETLFSSV